MKRVIEVYGSFAGEPVIGERAVILQNGKPTHYTSVCPYNRTIHATRPCRVWI